MTYNGYLPRTPFESECYLRGLVPSQVACALSFGRDMIAEYDACPEDDSDTNDNGCGNVVMSAVAPVVDDKEIYF
jgi:hypothetical protein